MSKKFDLAIANLKKYFGYDSFHPTQEKAIKAVLAGKDVVVLMPTGGGKSICYQIPALSFTGVTIVVSPLIALMKDQVDSLKVNGIAAEYLNSSLEFDEQNSVLDRLLSGQVKILYVSAEKLLSAQFASILRKITISLFAIDEAHCISAWGHDFRPDYTQLSRLKTEFPKVPIIALTATADSSTQADILTQLELKDPIKLIDSFDRPNISLSVAPGKQRFEKIVDFLKDKSDQPGIIYCLTRNQTEKLAEQLQQTGLVAACYHAGMSTVDRSKVQQNFVRDRTQIICATIAFGMGIDKSNVRWIIHYNLPKNIEGYYQEIGRAGRDGAPAQAMLLYTFNDVETLKQFANASQQKSLQLAKLDRMKEFAEGVICRRKIMLSYFGQTLKKNCGNCDVCSFPYPAIHGTEIVQKALHTIKNTSQLDSKNLLSQLCNSEPEVSFANWSFYLSQIKNLNLIKVDFSQNGLLALTPIGEKALAHKKEIKLVTLEEFIKRQEKSAEKSTKKAKKDYFKNPLFELLRLERLKIATEKNIAAYMVFSDKTLLEMANEKPKNEAEMKHISGVGEIKWQTYGQRFIDLIERVG